MLKWSVLPAVTMSTSTMWPLSSCLIRACDASREKTQYRVPPHANGGFVSTRIVACFGGGFPAMPISAIWSMMTTANVPADAEPGKLSVAKQSSARRSGPLSQRVVQSPACSSICAIAASAAANTSMPDSRRRLRAFRAALITAARRRGRLRPCRELGCFDGR